MDPRYLLVMGTLVYTLASHRVITTLDAVGARRSESPVVEARLRCFLAHEKAAGDGAPMRAEKCFDPLRR
jgi:hypothetical protein